MRSDGTTVYVSAEDAATLREIAAEAGIDVSVARQVLGLSDGPGNDEELRPRVAACYRLVLAPVSR